MGRHIPRHYTDHVREVASTRLGNHLDAHRDLHLFPRSSIPSHGLEPALIVGASDCSLSFLLAQSEAFQLTETNFLVDHRMYLPKSCYL